MSVIRVRKRDNPFVQIDRTVFEDDRISWKAKGMLGYLLSKPDNWQVYIADLENKSKDGRDAVRSGLKELEEAGYIRRTKKRNNKGRFEGWEYEVYETPVFSEIGKTEVGFSDFGLTDPSNKEISNKEVSNNKSLSIDEQEFFEETEMDKVSIEYQQKIGQINGDVALQLEHWRKEMGDELVIAAIHSAYERGKRSWSYIRGILKNWKAEGVSSLSDLEPKEKKKPARRGYVRANQTIDAIQAYIDSLGEEE